jgi:hypothetical protein
MTKQTKEQLKTFLCHITQQNIFLKEAFILRRHEEPRDHKATLLIQIKRNLD